MHKHDDTPALPVQKRKGIAAGAVASGATATGALAIGASALSGLAIGAMAVGAAAIGALAIGKLKVKRTRLDRVSIGELSIDRLTIAAAPVAQLRAAPGTGDALAALLMDHAGNFGPVHRGANDPDLFLLTARDTNDDAFTAALDALRRRSTDGAAPLPAIELFRKIQGQ